MAQCPGYGRSPGDRQTIRSYPGDLLADVVKSLGKTVALALLGSSQGACAVLNAALAVPDLAHYVAVCHPVGHDVKRYVAIRQPVLLAFDTEDDGHPVSVGHLMRRYLPRPHYFEFAESASPRWVETRFHAELLKMFDAYPVPRNASGNSTKLPDLTRLGGGIKAWAKAIACEFAGFEVPITDGSEHSTVPAVHAISMYKLPDESGDDTTASTELSTMQASSAAAAAAAPAIGTWQATVDAKGSVVYVNLATGARQSARPQAGIVKAAVDSAAAAWSELDLDEGENGIGEPQTEHERERREALAAEEAAAAAAAALEHSQCSRCAQLLYSPVRLTPCGHLQCTPCYSRYGRLFKRCAACGVGVSGAAAAEDALQARLRERLAAGELDQTQYTAQADLAAAAAAELASGQLLVLEYGNTADPPGPEDPRFRRNMSTFLRVASKQGVAAVKCVSFDINPGTPNPGVRLDRPDAGTNYTLARAMTRPFPCFITVKFAEKLGLPPVEVQHVTQHTVPKFTRRVVICGTPPPLPRHKKPAPVVVDVTDGSDAWVTWNTAGAPVVTRH